METITFVDKSWDKHQLIAELKALALPDLAFAGVRRSNRKILDDGSVRTEAAHFIEVKLRSPVSAADKRRITAVVEGHVPVPVAPTRSEELRAKNTAYKLGNGPRLTIEELREFTELSLL